MVFKNWQQFISPDQVLSAACQILFLGGFYRSFLFLVNNLVEVRNSSEEKLIWEEHDVTSKMDSWYLNNQWIFVSSDLLLGTVHISSLQDVSTTDG